MNLRYVVAVVVTTTLVLGSCGGGDDSSPSTTTTTTTTTTTDPAVGTAIDLVVTDEGIEGGARRESAELGENVTLRVSGDSTDVVHVHGYDLFLELEDGEGELTFPALIPGVFEVELEGSGVLLVQLEIS